MYSDRFTKDNPLIKLLYRGEKWIYKKADALVFTMEGAYDYIVKQGWEKEIPRSKVHYINNGVDLEQFDYNKEHFRVEDPDLNDPNIFKVVYTGSIRRVNNLGLLLDAAKCVKDPRVKRSPQLLTICRSSLMNSAKAWVLTPAVPQRTTTSSV